MGIQMRLSYVTGGDDVNSMGRCEQRETLDAPKTFHSLGWLTHTQNPNPNPPPPPPSPPPPLRKKRLWVLDQIEIDLAATQKIFVVLSL